MNQVRHKAVALCWNLARPWFLWFQETVTLVLHAVNIEIEKSLHFTTERFTVENILSVRVKNYKVVKRFSVFVLLVKIRNAVLGQGRRQVQRIQFETRPVGIFLIGSKTVSPVLQQTVGRATWLGKGSAWTGHDLGQFFFFHFQTFQTFGFTP